MVLADFRMKNNRRIEIERWRASTIVGCAPIYRINLGLGLEVILPFSRIEFHIEFRIKDEKSYHFFLESNFKLNFGLMMEAI